ncbi:S8 family serine peptidase [Streptomyces sp. V2I9]|uniref:S8 family serine peptidase n=1 Tax=Streptomyces sp. V2I9 TaxID=3042304 RepID=UPI00277E2875|nr:S8 family serine peptidase [Streptomyces sp. V2I9]MDQ0988464.1 membrane-anchored mycosin MYCP [Streptomyces sp. V2I9]
MAARAAGAGLAAGLVLLTAAVPAGASVRADGEQKLPAMPSALGDDPQRSPCTPASRTAAEQVDWSRQRLDLGRLRDHGTGEGVTVAVIDTGVAADAPALRGRVTAHGGAGEDCVGHGTFVAHLVAGAGGSSSDLAGVAPGARVLGLRGTDDRGRPDAALVARALQDATEAKADVITVSVALPRRSGELTRAVEAAVRSGAVVVAAAVPDPPAATEDPVPSRPYWPASEPGVISVLDMQPSGARSERALRTTGVDLAAPGVGVVAGGPRGSGHFLGSGASLAAAYTAGAAAVVRAAHPDASADEVARRLVSSAYPADVPQLDPYAAVTAVADFAAQEAAPAPVETVRMRDTSAADRATDRATLLAVGGGAGLLAVVWAAMTLPRARARGWRPAEPEPRN